MPLSKAATVTIPRRALLIAVSISLQPDGGGVLRLAGTSNFGPEIDVWD